MPQTEHADRLHATKYRAINEDFREYGNRCSFALADNGNHYHQLRDIFIEQRFCPGGRVQGAMGSTRKTTAYNCFVSGTITDSLCDGEGNIMQRLAEAAATMRVGGGIGYDFSTLRPRGDPCTRIESTSTGPVSFMEFYNAVCLGIHSSGHRRGAQMAMLRVDHPDIEEYIGSKQNATRFRGFNISVAITDAFMEAVANDSLFPLSFGGVTKREIRACDLWQKIMRSTWDWAEPGVFFVDTVNRMNNLWYCETIATTNPCAEQPLPPYGACLLGSFNLVKYLAPRYAIRFGSSEAIRVVGNESMYEFDYDQLAADIEPVVRAMDNVIDRTLYPLPEQEQEAKNKRRMGLGVMGLANTGEALGFSYGSPGFIDFTKKVLAVIRDGCYRASVQLAQEKGPFPLYDAANYLRGNFIATLPDDILDLIRRYGIRNSHLTSIAPTGTIALCADNVSSGVEPVFAYGVRRTILMPDGPIEEHLEDYGIKFLGVKGKLTADVTADEHIAVLLAGQEFVDSAVSKTCNVDGTMPWEDFTNVYARVHAGGGKGATTFNKDGLRGGIMIDANKGKNEGAACTIDETGARSCEG